LLLKNPEGFLLNYHPQKILKDSSVRTVSIVAEPQRELFIKRYKIRGITEKIKYFLIPSKARREWVIARHALSKGILTPLPLAMAERRMRGFLEDAFLITQAIVPSTPLIELIPAGRDDDLLFRAATLLKQAHEAGLFHQDLHAGNILVGHKEKKLYVIDLHRSIFLRSVSKQRRMWNLAQFFYSLKGFLSARTKKALLKRYDKGKNLFNEGFEEGLKKIERLEERIYRRHMQSRTKRCLKDSGGFYVVKRDRWKIRARRDWKPEELFAAAKAHHDIVTESKEGLIKDDRRTAITLFYYKGTRICVKEYRYGGVRRRLKEVFRRSKACRGWVMGNGLVVRGVAGIIPRALLEHRSWGCLREAFLIMESPPGYEELDRYMVKTFGATHHNRTKKSTFIKALTRFMADLYLRNIVHTDLKTCNIMVREERTGWRFGLVDMDDVQLDKKIHERRFLKALIQLHTSTPLFIGMKDRIGFLKQYLRLIRRYDVRDIAKKVIRGSRGKRLVYVAPEGDVMMDVDWEDLCRLSGAQLPLAKEDL
jgi:tRNA A-37 threonylcarbamoyl transferase component Bud32